MKRFPKEKSEQRDEKSVRAGFLDNFILRVLAEFSKWKRENRESQCYGNKEREAFQEQGQHQTLQTSCRR